MATLPPSTDFTDSGATQGDAKAFVTTLRTFIADLFGTDSSDKAAARAVLGAATAGNVPVDTHAATSKATPVDADELPVSDSAASFGLKKLTWANVKATLKTYFDGIYTTLANVLATKNSWTKPQRPHYLATDTVSATGSYTYDGDTKGQINLITLTNAITVTFAAPSNIVEGSPYTLMLKAGDTSARSFVWNAAYQNNPPGSGTIVSGKSDVLNFVGGASNTLIFNGYTPGV